MGSNSHSSLSTTNKMNYCGANLISCFAYNVSFVVIMISYFTIWLGLNPRTSDNASMHSNNNLVQEGTIKYYIFTTNVNRDFQKLSLNSCCQNFHELVMVTIS